MLASILFSIVLTIGVNKNKRLYRQQLAKVRARITFFSHFVNTGVRENCGFFENAIKLCYNKISGYCEADIKNTVMCNSN